jgi:hypothetical protein
MGILQYISAFSFAALIERNIIYFTSVPSNVILKRDALGHGCDPQHGIEYQPVDVQDSGEVYDHRASVFRGECDRGEETADRVERVNDDSDER